MKTTVNYYDSTATRIVRIHTYERRDAADRAMARARAKGQSSAIAGRRTVLDPPTTHS